MLSDHQAVKLGPPHISTSPTHSHSLEVVKFGNSLRLYQAVGEGRQARGGDPRPGRVKEEGARQGPQLLDRLLITRVTDAASHLHSLCFTRPSLYCRLVMLCDGDCDDGDVW